MPVIARPRRPLSSNASTDSCSIRFSLRTMISGAFNSNSRFRRLLRLITRRYKSFKSDVAKRPPSSGTKGRKSGGNIGNTDIIIHSGRLPDSIMDSTSFNLLEIRFNLVSDLVSPISVRKVSVSFTKLRSLSMARIASAPILASNSSPCSSSASRNASSESNWPRSRVVTPGSTTMNASK